MKALLDTNFMMVPHQFGVDIYEFLKYYEIATLFSCIEELKKISKRGSEDGKAAKIALQLVKRNSVEIIKAGGRTDKAILDYAAAERCAVATNDKNLIKALKNKGIKIIRLKQSKYLVEE